MTYPKRLIEVDLPIARISAHARREKSIRHGHISTLHIWWARRPLAACRAVICAALWPDPADPLCPRPFIEAAAAGLIAFARRVNPDRLSAEGRQLQETLSPEARARWDALAAGTLTLDADDPTTGGMLRMCLLDFIADFANWDNCTVPAYLETSRALTQAAHEALGGEPGTRPLVVDPFAGGGSIPLEALRVGADAFASDLNPVAVLLNKVVLEYIPKYGQSLTDEVRQWGQWVKEQAELELAKFYPEDPDGATPIAYLWARTIRCEGPGCGAEVPLIRSLWLAKKANRSVAMRLVPVPDEKRVDFQIVLKQRDGWVDQANPEITIGTPTFDGTVKRGSATCPCCGYTTPVARLREQLKLRRGGTHDARLYCVVTTHTDSTGRHYRLPTPKDLKGIREAAVTLERIKQHHSGPLSLVPNELIPKGASRDGGGSPFTVFIYGIERWADLFTPRQLLSLTTLAKIVWDIRVASGRQVNGISDALQACLAMVVNKLADKSSSLCRWKSSAEYMAGNTFSRQALPMVLDFCEANVFGGVTGDIRAEVSWLAEMLSHVVESAVSVGNAERRSAMQQSLPDDAAQAFVTDPPYYDAVPYADLSDFFFVWFRRSLPFFGEELQESPKAEECIVDNSRNKDKAYFERQMLRAMSEGRRVIAPSGVGVIVFAHKSTSGWEAQLQAMIDAGWVVTGSWPIDTEMGSRLRAMDSAALASSVHLVCRPRENADGSVRIEVGDWRDVLAELPHRIHNWMPRLAAEGVVGADAIFACLGPALEVFSRYSRVEKANGEQATLREYLEHVWAAVSTEALSLIFRDADAAGLEPDARLTAMWFWTLGGGAGTTNGNGKSTKRTAADTVAIAVEESAAVEVSEEEDGEAADGAKAAKVTGYTLEFDAARKIAQGLGVHLEHCETIVEVKGDKARLLPVAERTRHLFGRAAQDGAVTGGRGKKKPKQQTLFHELDEAEAAEAGWTEVKGPPPGTTALDRLHQSMILFAAGRGELLKRFLLEDGVGRDTRFWKLAQSLSALYPAGTDEKRWVDGVLARKKGLGL